MIKTIQYSQPLEFPSTGIYPLYINSDGVLKYTVLLSH